MRRPPWGRSGRVREGRPTRPAVPALALRALLVGGSGELVSLRRGVQASRAKKRVPWSGLQGQVRSRSRCEASGWGCGPGGSGRCQADGEGQSPSTESFVSDGGDVPLVPAGV